MKPSYVSAAHALKSGIRKGDRVLIASCCGEPRTLVEALGKYCDDFPEMEIVSGMLLGEYPFLRDGWEKRFRYSTTHVTARIREDVKNGKIGFIPMRHLNFLKIFSPGSNCRPVDVALIQVSPPDRKGFCNLGVAVGYTLPMSLSARTVIAEVNEKMPLTCGESSIHSSRISFFVPSECPLHTYAPQQGGDIEEKIAAFVVDLIPDGSTLQIGIGSIPSAIMRFLHNRREIGIHSGMITDEIIDLIENGTVTNLKKGICRGKTVTGELMGTERLFAFAHRNSRIEMHPLTYTHDPIVISDIDNFITITSALEIDLSGQVNSESLSGFQVGGVGGQFDFIEGAYFSKGGRSIIALPSTGKGGKLSRIVAGLDYNAVVTIPRYSVEYVVTEYGAVNLFGKTLFERAEALISIAHPDYRESLGRIFRNPGLALRREHSGRDKEK